MKLTKFFTAVEWKESESYPFFYLLGHEDPHSFYVTTYDKRDNGSKESILGLMGKKPKDFDFHHIIEKRHLADISIDGMLDINHGYKMPVVLLHNLEHRLAFTSILSTKETRYLYMNKETGYISLQQKQLEAIKLYKSAEGKKLLAERVAAMKKLYSQVYETEPLLKQVANNILDSYPTIFV
ncbi:MAG: hypothetical protein JWQ09_5686 [Segetibacter sp.]|nr:hypothetical protein [Segetibacter sp.]